MYLLERSNFQSAKNTRRVAGRGRLCFWRKVSNNKFPPPPPPVYQRVQTTISDDWRHKNLHRKRDSDEKDVLAITVDRTPF